MADETLTGIPSIPAGAPKEIVGWMTSVRSRLLGMKDQFTSTEVTKLKALIASGGNTSTASPTVKTPSVVMLAQPVQFYSGGGENFWKSYSAVTAGVPAGSSAVIIQAVWWLVGKVTIATRTARLRVDPSKGNGDPTKDTFILCNSVGTDDDGSDSVSGSQQGIYPLKADGSFEYVSAAGTNGWTGISLDVVGYIP